MIFYLAGPIAGCTDEEANDWRSYVKSRVGEENCLDPMRRDYRGHENDYAAEIVAADRKDIEDSDIVLANCWKVSWGTAMEIFYAHSIGKRVLAVVPAFLPVSPWVFHHSEVYTSLEEALGACRVEPEFIPCLSKTLRGNKI